MAVAAVAPWMVDKVAVKAAVVERGQAEMVPVKAAEKAVVVEKDRGWRRGERRRR